MKLRLTAFALALMLAISLTGLKAYAEDTQNLNLSDAQVYRIQAILLEQTREIRTLSADLNEAHEALNAAVAQGDPAITAMALLSLDAAEKALKQTQLANQRNLMSVLSESQKQAVAKESSPKSIPASE
jgi:precorrin-3B methylase